MVPSPNACNGQGWAKCIQRLGKQSRSLSGWQKPNDLSITTATQSFQSMGSGSQEPESGIKSRPSIMAEQHLTSRSNSYSPSLFLASVYVGISLLKFFT